MWFQRNLLVASILACVVIGGEALAQGVEGYVASGTQCSDVFVSSKNGLAFSRNVDVFAPAFLIKGKTLSTPTATCKLRRSSAKGDVRELHFECVNSISYSPVNVFFRRGENGSLIRLASETETIGSRYDRCNR